MVFLKIKALKEKDLGELKRAVEKLKKTVHVMPLSATPIPRTLYLALAALLGAPWFLARIRRWPVVFCDVLAMTRFGGYSDVLCAPERQVFARPAGMSAAAKARRVNPELEIVVYEKMGYVRYVNTQLKKFFSLLFQLTRFFIKKVQTVFILLNNHSFLER